MYQVLHHKQWYGKNNEQSHIHCVYVRLSNQKVVPHEALLLTGHRTRRNRQIL